MAFYDKFPYTNFQELNLDWLLQEVSKVKDNRDASASSAAAAQASEQAAKASETAAASSQQAAASSQQAAAASQHAATNSALAAAGSAEASAEYLQQIGTHTAGAAADWLKENLTSTTPPIDTSLTVSGAAADAKATGDRISSLDSPEIKLLSNKAWQDTTIPQIIGYPNATASNGFITFNKNAVFDSDMRPGTGNHFMYCDADKKLIGDVNKYSLIPDTAKYFVFWTIYPITYINYTMFASGKLQGSLAPFLKVIKDEFSSAAIQIANEGTNSKNGNEITFVLSGNGSYFISSYNCIAGHKYILAYDLLGTGVGLNTYNFQLRLYNSGWKYLGENVIQTIGTKASGQMVISPSTGQDGLISFDIPDMRGLTLTGTVYVYDVTNIPEAYIERINFLTAGAEKTFLFSSDVNSWVGKKVVFYGDSITAQNYPQYVQQYYQFTMVNAGVGGSTITYRSDTDMSSDTRINALPADADLVVIMGGTNDWGKIKIGNDPLTYDNGFNRATFKGALAYIIQKIQARCTNAKIIVATLIGGRNETRNGSDPVVQYLPQADSFGQTDLDFRNAEIEVAETLNIPVCDTWSCGINGMNAMTMIADTVHTSETGAHLIADYIIGYFKTVHFNN